MGEQAAIPVCLGRARFDQRQDRRLGVTVVRIVIGLIELVEERDRVGGPGLRHDQSRKARRGLGKSARSTLDAGRVGYAGHRKRRIAGARPFGDQRGQMRFAAAGRADQQYRLERYPWPACPQIGAELLVEQIDRRCHPRRFGAQMRGDRQRAGGERLQRIRARQRQLFFEHLEAAGDGADPFPFPGVPFDALARADELGIGNAGTPPNKIGHELGLAHFFVVQRESAGRVWF